MNLGLHTAVRLAETADGRCLSARPMTPKRHLRIASLGLLMLMPLSGWLSGLAITTQLAWVAVPIAVLGVMHGALDPWVGDRVWACRYGRPGRHAFLLAYLAAMSAVVMAWIAAPLFTLGAFLLISILHFGAQDAAALGRSGDALATVVLGAIPVFAPIIAHPEEVALVFQWLPGLEADQTAPLLRWLFNPVIALWIVGCGMWLSRMQLLQEDGLAPATGLLVVLLAAMLLLPPLIAFSAYFCLLHSPAHLLRMLNRGDSPWSGWRGIDWLQRLGLVTLSTILLGLLAWGLIALLDPAAMPGTEALARVIFCGLAALTVPHVLLHALHDSRQFAAPDRAPR